MSILTFCHSISSLASLPYPYSFAALFFSFPFQHHIYQTPTSTATQHSHFCRRISKNLRSTLTPPHPLLFPLTPSSPPTRHSLQVGFPHEFAQRQRFPLRTLCQYANVSQYSSASFLNARLYRKSHAVARPTMYVQTTTAVGQSGRTRSLGIPLRLLSNPRPVSFAPSRATTEKSRFTAEPDCSRSLVPQISDDGPRGGGGGLSTAESLWRGEGTGLESEGGGEEGDGLGTKRIEGKK